MSTKTMSNSASQDVDATSDLSIIPASRVRQHIDKLGINSAVEDALKLQEPILAPLEELKTKRQKLLKGTSGKDAEGKVVELVPALAKDHADVLAVEKQIEEMTEKLSSTLSKNKIISKSRKNISKYSADILCGFFDRVAGDVIVHAAANTPNTIVKPNHIYTGNYKQMASWPVLQSLPSVVAMEAQTLAANRQTELDKLYEQTKKETKKEVENNYKKLYTLTPKKNVVVTAPQVVEVVKQQETPNKPTSEGNNFVHYVKQLADKLAEKKNTSTEFKQHVSDIIIDICNQFSTLVNIETLANGCKTVSESMTYTIIKSMLCKNYESQQEIVINNVELYDKVETKRLKLEQDEKRKTDPTYKADFTNIKKVVYEVATQKITFTSKFLDDYDKFVQTNYGKYL